MSEHTSDLEPVKIFWTGGWDSTFQLLHLIFSEQRCCEPYYLIDEDRLSTGTELLTMKQIQATIREISEEAAMLIKPTILFAVSSIPKYKKISNAYLNIKKDKFIGEQYD